MYARKLRFNFGAVTQQMAPLQDEDSWHTAGVEMLIAGKSVILLHSEKKKKLFKGKQH